MKIGGGVGGDPHTLDGLDVGEGLADGLHVHFEGCVVVGVREDEGRLVPSRIVDGGPCAYGFGGLPELEDIDVGIGGDGRTGLIDIDEVIDVDVTGIEAKESVAHVGKLSVPEPDAPEVEEEVSELVGESGGIGEGLSDVFVGTLFAGETPPHIEETGFGVGENDG